MTTTNNTKTYLERKRKYPLRSEMNNTTSNIEEDTKRFRIALLYAISYPISFLVVAFLLYWEKIK